MTKPEPAFRIHNSGLIAPSELSGVQWLTRPPGVRMAGADGSVALALRGGPVLGAGVSRWEGVFATNEPFRVQYLARGDDNEVPRWILRWLECRLALQPGNVVSRMDTIAGVPVAWGHMLGYRSGAIGRVENLMVSEGRLSGSVVLSEAELVQWAPGGTTDLGEGLHRGISIGFDSLDSLRIRKSDGTMKKPDKLVFGRIRVIEVSITDVPMLGSAGLTRRLDSETADNDTTGADDG